jgi:hypothetical protein
VLTFVLAAIGTLGIGGFIALAVFAPPIAAQVARIAFDLFDRLISTRWGVALLTAIACLTFGNFYFDHRGAARVRAQWDAAEQRQIAKGNSAHDEAEREIPPVEENEPVAPTRPPEPKSHLPNFLHFPKASDACPPAPLPQCDPRAARPAGPVPDWMRHDPHHRNDR